MDMFFDSVERSKKRRVHFHEFMLEVHDALHALPSVRRGEVLAAIDCLGSDPRRIIETDELSPGEVRKLILALGLEREPHLVVMDEPTNHLDLPSIECLQNALVDCRCALLLVSHDDPFLGATTTTAWSITPDRADASAWRLDVRQRSNVGTK